jgi:hypothetical protein
VKDLKNTSGKTPKTEGSETIEPVTVVKPAKIVISSLKILFIRDQIISN